MLPNVPRISTSWLPRRAPYELNSTGVTPCSWSHWPAGLHAGIDPAGRDVVGRDRVAEDRQRARARGCPRSAPARAACPRRTAARDVGRVVVPGVAVARRAPAARASGRRPRTPSRSARKMSGETAAAMVSLTSSGDGQMSARKTGWPSLPVPSGSVLEVDLHASGERERHHERRRGQVGRLGRQRVDATLEVAVAREDRGDDQVVAPRPRRRSASSGPLLPMHVVQP